MLSWNTAHILKIKKHACCLFLFDQHFTVYFLLFMFLYHLVHFLLCLNWNYLHKNNISYRQQTNVSQPYFVPRIGFLNKVNHACLIISRLSFQNCAKLNSAISGGQEPRAQQYYWSPFVRSNTQERVSSRRILE